jgi:hypothetical protein
MALQLGTTLRNNQASQIQTTIGASGHLKIFSGAVPANPAAADPAGPLCDITLPAAFLTSTGGVTTIAGSWSVAASGTGTAQSFRMYDGSAVCHVQGNVTTDLTLNNTSIASGQTVQVTSFTVTVGNA